MENGALVHASCHPKTAKAVTDFATHWQAKLEKQRAGVAAVGAVTPSDAAMRTPAESVPMRVKRGRPKLSPEEVFVRKFEKLGMPSEMALELARAAALAASSVEPF